MAQVTGNTANGRDNEELRTLLSLHAIAMSNIAHGVLILDADLRVVFFNRPSADILCPAGHAIHLGVPLRKALDEASGAMALPSSTMEDMWTGLREMFARRQEFQFERRVRPDALITFRCKPVGGGGWVCTCESSSGQRQSENDLKGRFDHLTQIIEHMSHGVCLYNRDRKLLTCNDRYREIYGFKKEQIRPGMSYRSILALSVELGIYSGVTADDLVERRTALFGTVPQREVGYLSDGRVVEITVRPVGSQGWIAEYDDITLRLHAEEALQARNALLDAALENMAHGLCAFDEHMRVVVVNQRYLKMYRLTADEACPGTPMIELMRQSIARGIHVPGSNAEGMFADLKARLIDNKEPVLYRHLSDGCIVAVRHQPTAAGGWVGTYEDVTERHRSEQNIAYMARHDALTDLPNRLLFHEQMSDGLARVERGGTQLAVMCLDLDNFKAVNDSLGHPVGDKLLQMVAKALSKVLKHNDTIARLGGDEFAILHPTENAADTEELARRLIATLSEPIVIDGHEIITGISIGTAIAPNHGRTSDQLMKCADVALYRAKAIGRNTHLFFEASMDADIRKRRNIELDLRHALMAEDEFHAVYQPQIQLATHQVVGMEALVRWMHPERGVIMPGEFIPVAEETGLIVPLGELVLRKACAEAAKWPETVRIAVNLSPIQLRNRDLLATVKSAISNAGIAANRLELEITEAVLLQKDDAILRTLHELRALGVQIAMDDFGTGYSSLSYLRSFPFDRIKIDRSFISGNSGKADAEPIIRAIVQLGASQGIETIAEGIETKEQLQLVQRAGCTEAQGFLFGKPRAEWTLSDFLTLQSGAEQSAKPRRSRWLRRAG